MRQVPLKELKDDLSRYLRLAVKEDIIITRHGVPAGILIGLEDPDDWWEEMLLRDPRFKARVAQARRSAREGRVFTIEQIREEFGIPEPQAVAAERKRRRSSNKKQAASNNHTKRGST
jgi:prevent-host-death family protein